MADVRIEAFEGDRAKAFIAAVLAGQSAKAIEISRTIPGGVNTLGKDGQTAVLFAVLRNDGATVQALLAAGANPNGGPDRAPLHPAVRDPSGRLVDLLLAAKADPNLPYNGETPLLEAALIDAKPNAAKLLQAGALVAKGRSNGASPAIVAASTDHWTMVSFLIERGASPWYAPPNGATIASFAAASRVPPDTPEGEARDAIIARFQSLGYPWPPPRPPLVRQMMAEGRWPPPLRRP